MKSSVCSRLLVVLSAIWSSGHLSASPEKLITFPDPDYKLSGCVDNATVATLNISKKDQSKAVVSLKQVNLGQCEVFIQPDYRRYPLRMSIQGCGVKLYSSPLAKGKPHIEIVDTRESICDDTEPTVIIRESRRGGPATTTFLWKEADEPIIDVTYITGSLQREFAVGGETSGYVVGDVEVEFSTPDLSEMADTLIGLEVLVGGHFETRKGVVRPDRKVFVVKTLSEHRVFPAKH